MKHLIILVAFLFFTISAVSAGIGGSIFGIIKDEKTDKEIPEAEITVQTGYGTTKLKSLPNGYYSLMVPAGTGYIITVKKPGYEEKRVDNIKVNPNDATEVNISLTKSFKPETLKYPMKIPQGNKAIRIIKPKEE